MLLVLVMEGKKISHTKKRLCLNRPAANIVSYKIYFNSEHTFIYVFAIAAFSHLTSVQN